jgi:hypothetical protein
MYRCEVCDRVVESGVACTRIVVETRPVEYPLRERVHYRPPKDGKKARWDPDPGGRGTETVRELAACPECAAASAKK